MSTLCTQQRKAISKVYAQLKNSQKENDKKTANEFENYLKITSDENCAAFQLSDSMLLNQALIESQQNFQDSMENYFEESFSPLMF